MGTVHGLAIKIVVGDQTKLPTDYNFIIVNSNYQQQDCQLFFGGEQVILINAERTVDMYDLLVLADVFPSKSVARKNWKTNDGSIQSGFSDFTGIGKMNKRITILNPRGDTNGI